MGDGHTTNQPYLDDGDVKLYQGDALDVLAGLPKRSVQTVVTSPPYWGLRDYGTGTWLGGDDGCDHLGPPMRTNNAPVADQSSRADGSVKFHGGNQRANEPWPSGECGKCGATRTDSQLGLEATPDLYVQSLVAVFRGVWRVLRDDGSVWLNLGDSFYSSTATQGRNENRSTISTLADHGANGRSPALDDQTSTTFHRRADGLKPKDLVGIPWRVAFALQADGWYLRSDIVWSKPNPMPESVTDRPTKAHEYVFLLSKQPRYFYDADAIREPHSGGSHSKRSDGGLTPYEVEMVAQGRAQYGGIGGYLENATGRNTRSVWTIATQPTPEAHFATFPESLVRPCILAGSRPGDCVLDPFVGSGTTALVARKHGRRAIGIDLNADYLAIAARRLSQLSLLSEVSGG